MWHCRVSGTVSAGGFRTWSPAGCSYPCGIRPDSRRECLRRLIYALSPTVGGGTIRWRPYSPVVKGSSFGLRAERRQTGINTGINTAAWPSACSRQAEIRPAAFHRGRIVPAAIISRFAIRRTSALAVAPAPTVTGGSETDAPRRRHRDGRLAGRDIDRQRDRDGQGDCPTYGQGLGQILVLDDRSARASGLAATIRPAALEFGCRLFCGVRRSISLRTRRNGKRALGFPELEAIVERLTSGHCLHKGSQMAIRVFRRTPSIGSRRTG